MSWSALTTPFDGSVEAVGYQVAFAPGLGASGRLVAVANQDDADQGRVLTSDDGGATWTDRGQILGQAQQVVWAEAIGLFIATGLNLVTFNGAAVTSIDGITWGVPAEVFGGSPYPTSLATNMLGDIVVAVTDLQQPYTTTDGITWTAQTSAFGAQVDFDQVIWVDSLSLWFQCGTAGLGGHQEVLASSPDAVTWTPISTPLDDLFAQGLALGFHVATGQIYLYCYANDPGPTYRIIRSGDGGATWTTDSSPFGPSASSIAGFADAGTLLVAAGTLFGYGFAAAAATPGDGTWSVQTTPLDGGISGDTTFGTRFASTLGTFLAGRAPGGATILVLGDPSFDPTLPAAPASLTCTRGDTQIEIDWTTPYPGTQPITGYNIYRGLTPGSETFLTSVGVTNTYLDTGLVNGTSYYYVVTAVSSVGEGAQSDETHCIPQPPGPWTQRANPFDATMSGSGYVYTITAADGLSVTFWDPVLLEETFATIYGLAWSPTELKWVAVGSDAIGQPRVLTSPDGDVWTDQAAPFDSDGFFNNVFWAEGPELFVAVGYSGSALQQTVATSPDGITWTIQTSPFDGGGTGYGGCWSPDLNLMIVTGITGDGGSTLIASSPDGVTFSAQVTPWDNTSFLAGTEPQGACWAPTLGLFVVAGFQYDGLDFASTIASILTSPDAVTWTSISTPADNAGGGGTFGSLSAVIWSPTLTKLVAGGSNAVAETYVVVSDDGVTWTAVPTAFGPGTGASVSSLTDDGERVYATGFAEPTFLGGAVTGQYSTMQSTPDGITWTRESPPSDPGGETTYVVAYSPDLDQVLLGSYRSSGLGAQISKRGATSSNLVLAAGQTPLASGVVCTSPNAIDWYLRSQNVVGSPLAGSAWSPELHLYLGVGFGEILASPDGIVYGPVSPSFFDGAHPWGGKRIAWSSFQGKFAAVGQYGFSGSAHGQTSIIWTADGVTWATALSPLDWITGLSYFGSGSGICYSPDLDLWVAVGGTDISGNAIICTASDPAGPWTQQVLGVIAGNALQEVAWVPFIGLFVAVGSNPVGTWTSPDGVTWTQRPNDLDGGGSPSYGITEDGFTVLVGGENADESICVIRSTDAIAWTDDPTPFDANGTGQGVYDLETSAALALFLAGGAGGFS